MNRDEVILLLSKVKDEMHQKYRVETIGLFGSFARGTETDESDIDIYAEFEPEADILDYSGLSLELEARFHRSVDIATPHGIREEMRSSIYQDLIVI